MPSSDTQKITTFLWFDGNAEEAVELYVAAFARSRVVDVSRDPGGRPRGITFELDGQRFIAFDGGPHYRFTPAISLYVSVSSQEELDRTWDALLAGGGKPTRCGWLEDRFGLSWQIVPSVLPKLLGDPDPERAGRAMNAMLGMVKLDIAELERAADGKGDRHSAALRSR